MDKILLGWICVVLVLFLFYRAETVEMGENYAASALSNVVGKSELTAGGTH